MKKLLTLVMALSLALCLCVPAMASGEPSAEPSAEASGEASVVGTYVYEEVNAFGLSILWTIVLNEDGTYALSEENTVVGLATYTGTYVSGGNVAVCSAMNEVGPEIYDWANPAGFSVTVDGEGGFVPGGELPAASVAGTYTYTEVNAYSLEILWTLELTDDGAYALTEENVVAGVVTYTGTYTADGDVVTCGPMAEAGPPVYDWSNPAGFVVTVSGESFVPGIQTASAEAA